MDENPCGFRARSNRGMLHGDEFRTMSAPRKPRHQKKRLLLPSTPHAFEIHQQYAYHLQTSRACGQARASSFPPRTSTPSLRYFCQT